VVGWPRRPSTLRVAVGPPQLHTIQYHICDVISAAARACCAVPVLLTPVYFEDLTSAEGKKSHLRHAPGTLSFSEFSVDLRHTSPKHNVGTAPRRAGDPRVLGDVLAYRLVQNVTFPERRM
jgi:hypothetical protein